MSLHKAGGHACWRWSGTLKTFWSVLASISSNVLSPARCSFSCQRSTPCVRKKLERIVAASLAASVDARGQGGGADGLGSAGCLLDLAVLSGECGLLLEGQLDRISSVADICARADGTKRMSRAQPEGGWRRLVGVQSLNEFITSSNTASGRTPWKAVPSWAITAQLHNRLDEKTNTKSKGGIKQHSNREGSKRGEKELEKCRARTLCTQFTLQRGGPPPGKHHQRSSLNARSFLLFQLFRPPPCKTEKILFRR